VLLITLSFGRNNANVGKASRIILSAQSVVVIGSFLARESAWYLCTSAQETSA